MPLVGDALGSAIATAIKGIPPADQGDPEKIWKAISKALVTYLVANTVVTTAGSAAAQTGTIS